MPNSVTLVSKAATDIRELQRMPTAGPIDIEMDERAAVSYRVCGGGEWTHTRPEV